jgi:hypothetical protein
VALVSFFDGGNHCDAIGTVVHVTKGRRLTIETTQLGGWNPNNRYPVTYRINRDNISYGEPRCWHTIVELTPELEAQYEASEVERNKELNRVRTANDLREVRWEKLPGDVLDSVMALVKESCK